MTASPSTPTRFIHELRRRRVFRTAGLYIVGAWLVIQVADVLFPGWGLPDAAVNVVLLAAVLGFPLALVFGWFFDITSHGLVRTPRAGHSADERPLPLQRFDYGLLTALTLVAGAIVYDAVRDIADTSQVAEELAIGADEPAPLDKPTHSIAVLPFANVSNDPDNDVFCDGVSEEILHRLTEFAALHVIGRTSSFAFKGSDYQLPRISDLLGVRYLLQGSVRKAGNQLRITAQLVDEAGVQQWSGAFDRRYEEIFAIQSEIADLVATTVVPQIVPQHADGYEPDLEAYQHYLVGRDLLHKREVLSAREELAMAVARDPNFAEAWAEYAISLLMWDQSEEQLARAREGIELALKLKPGLPRARAARGLDLWYGPDRDLDEAERLLRGVLVDEPNMVDASNWLAATLAEQGQLDEADEVQMQAMRLDPLHPAIAMNQANTYASKGEYGKSIAIVERLANVPDPSPMILMDSIGAYRGLGDLESMLAAARRYVDQPRSEFWAARSLKLAEAYAVLGDFESAQNWLDKAATPEPNHAMEWQFWLIARIQGPIWRSEFAEAMTLFEDLMESRGMAPDEVPARTGVLLALAGRHEEAQALLEPLLEQAAEIRYGDDALVAAAQTLAWSHSITGTPERSRKYLEELETFFRTAEQYGRLHASPDLYDAARNAYLLGNQAVALERLQRAVEAGWRDYYLELWDPRWGELRESPQFQTLMRTVKADVDRQAAAILHSAPGDGDTVH